MNNIPTDNPLEDCLEVYRETLEKIAAFSTPPSGPVGKGPPPKLKASKDYTQSCNQCEQFSFVMGSGWKRTGKCIKYGMSVAEEWTCDDFEPSK